MIAITLMIGRTLKSNSKLEIQKSKIKIINYTIIPTWYSSICQKLPRVEITPLIHQHRRQLGKLLALISFLVKERRAMILLKIMMEICIISQKTVVFLLERPIFQKLSMVLTKSRDPWFKHELKQEIFRNFLRNNNNTAAKKDKFKPNSDRERLNLKANLEPP